MKPALILFGTPGSGKTVWVKEEARLRGLRLFRWNVRNDRSLREGREVLHSQVRSQEKTLIWIEGADDLTQEAQAFLRRILDTRSDGVFCILEVRDPSKMSAPVLSRCTLRNMAVEKSYRKQFIEGKARDLGILDNEQLLFPTNLSELVKYKASGADPNTALFWLAARKESPTTAKKGLEALRRYAAGSSAWLQIAWLLSDSAFRNNAQRNQ